MSEPLDELRDRLASVTTEEPVAERVASFERANEVLAAELAALDELTSG